MGAAYITLPIVISMDKSMTIKNTNNTIDHNPTRPLTNNWRSIVSGFELLSEDLTPDSNNTDVTSFYLDRMYLNWADLWGWWLLLRRRARPHPEHRHERRVSPEVQGQRSLRLVLARPDVKNLLAPGGLLLQTWNLRPWAKSLHRWGFFGFFTKRCSPFWGP